MNSHGVLRTVPIRICLMCMPLARHCILVWPYQVRTAHWICMHSQRRFRISSHHRFGIIYCLQLSKISCDRSSIITVHYDGQLWPEHMETSRYWQSWSWFVFILKLNNPRQGLFWHTEAVMLAVVDLVKPSSSLNVTRMPSLAIHSVQESNYHLAARIWLNSKQHTHV